MNPEPHSKSSAPLLVDKVGHRELLLGNEAIVRGAIEAGVGFACGYPGTPSTEVTDGFAKLAPMLGIPFEYSVNEKIALEMAFAASLSGVRSIVAMKHLGLMYAGDPLSTIPYIGTAGGMVIVSAADPSCFTSPNEQDQRHLADMLHTPLFDPRTPQEALEVTRFAFELSERCELPVIIRPTTRVCHTMAPVRFGKIEERRDTGFVRNPGRFIPMPATARKLRLEIKNRLATAQEIIEGSAFFDRQGAGSTAILASGVPASTCTDLLVELGWEEEVALLTLGVIYPLPVDWLIEQLREVETLLVVEELSPYLEDHVRALVSLHGLSTRVLGKRTGHLPEENEYGQEVVREGLHRAFGLGEPLPLAAAGNAPALRPPTLCPSCPHRSAFFAARTVFGPEPLFFNDIGCYTLGVAPPLFGGEALLSMGAGFTLAAGVARTTGQRTVGFLGDSTFFHSGMPALLNAVKNDVNMVAVIMNNEVTAMTGFQESPAVKIEDGEVVRKANIEGVVRALGARQVVTVDPYDLTATIAAFEYARDGEGLTVIITERTCPIYLARLRLDNAEVVENDIATFRVDADRCGHCGRSGCEHQCDLDSDKDFARVAARARALEIDRDIDRPEVAACAEACPLYLCVQGYTSHIAAGRYADALRLIMDRLPLPESVCRVCHRPCEAQCPRRSIDAPIAINDLKRFVMEWANAQEEFPYRPELEAEHGRRVAIVGMGPAGLAAAQELRRRGYAVHGFDGHDAPGGLLHSGIPAYRLPAAARQRDVQRILDLGVSFEGGRTLGENLQLDQLLGEYDAVLLAIGAGRGVELKIPAPESAAPRPRVIDALEYLRGPQETARRVVVIGGGNSAIDAARTAVRHGAEKAVVVCLEEWEYMPAIPEEIREAERDGVFILTEHRAMALRATGVDLVHVQPRVPGGLDPDNFEAVAGSEETVEADLVIIAIGQATDESALEGCGIEWARDSGLVRIDAETGACSHPRVFAAGDLVREERSVTAALADGMRAAWGLDRSLRGAEAADRRPPPPRLPATPRPPSNKAWRNRREERHDPPQLDPVSRIGSFDEEVGVFSEAQARAEASRCLFCGMCGSCKSCLDLFGCPAFKLGEESPVIEPSLCLSCGVCAQFCPNEAIVPVLFEEEVAR